MSHILRGKKHIACEKIILMSNEWMQGCDRWEGRGEGEEGGGDVGENLKREELYPTRNLKTGGGAAREEMDSVGRTVLFITFQKHNV